MIDQGRPEEAEVYLRQAITTWEDLPKRQQPGLALTQSTLGRALTMLGRFGEAEQLLITSHTFFVESVGSDHRWTREARQWLDEAREASP